MEEMKFHIIIAGSTTGEGSPLVVELKSEYMNVAYISYFKNVDDAMSFVEKHLLERIIILMDCRFGSSCFEAVAKLRENNSLIPIIFVSSSDINKLPNKDVMGMINSENVFIINNSDVIAAKEIIEKIRNQWNVRFDCVLEQWLIRHPEDNSKEAFSEASTGRTYSWTDILIELRKQTPVGKSFEHVLNEYYIYQINRSKK